MNKIAITIALLGMTVSALAQNCTDGEIKKLEKQFRRSKNDIHFAGGASLAHTLSGCYANVNDSLRRFWLETAIRQRKIHYKDLDPQDKVAVFRDVGLYYSELNDQVQAAEWYSKWTKAACEAPEAYYNHGRSLLYLRRGEDALTEFRIAERKGSTRNDLDSLLSEAIKASATGGHRLQRLDSLNLTGYSWHFRSNERLRGFIFNYGRYDYFVPNPNGDAVRTEEDLEMFFTSNRDAAIQIRYSQGDEYLNVYSCADTILLDIGTMERAEPFKRVVVADVVINTTYTIPEVSALRRREPFLHENNFISEGSAIAFWYFAPNQLVTSIVCFQP